jgi:transposase-like protein
MTQEQRDRLVTLKKAAKKLITQKKAAEELKVDPRHVRRLLIELRDKGDQSVIHGLKGQPSNRRILPATRDKAIRVLSAEVYQGFGPTLARESLEEKHKIQVSKETLRQWMISAKLWRAKPDKIEKAHVWRARRSRWGELIQWDTSEHDWLEGRGEKLYLIAMIDDATSQLLARFVRHDSTEENLRLLWTYLEKHGRPLAFYTDKAGLFQTAEKRRRDQPGVDQDPREMPPTQIERALRELGITWIPAHSPQAKGRIERSFDTAQDRLVKKMREAKVKTLEQANRFLEQKYLPWWNQTLIVPAVCSDNAHRPLDPTTDLAASLSWVHIRQVGNDYTLQWRRRRYQIERSQIVPGLRNAAVRIEQRLDGSMAVRYQDRYLTVTECAPVSRQPPVERKTQPAHRSGKSNRDWNKSFDLQKAPPVWRAAEAAGYRREGQDAFSEA